jgi:hypothetical protein
VSAYAVVAATREQNSRPRRARGRGAVACSSYELVLGTQYRQGESLDLHFYRLSVTAEASWLHRVPPAAARSYRSLALGVVGTSTIENYCSLSFPKTIHYTVWHVWVVQDLHGHTENNTNMMVSYS